MKYYRILFDVKWKDGNTERFLHHDTVGVTPTLNGDQIVVEELVDVTYPFEDASRLTKWMVVFTYGQSALKPRPQFEVKEYLNTEYIERLIPHKIEVRTYER
ncbi:hypothetical protein M199_gp187 [Halogranum tailed virus 1]|uniref:Uncharacterized protein n=1 Tax=Halogranum tailed virus 1 TaxID=1273749 RepID=R4T6Z4_9CAUD|nr:hypothetical protein M199_gp187 [Halogranum tailed virus 1]AGM11479.1 hypothetical protein HGTV1_182 [Halogranum tailed virus 1]